MLVARVSTLKRSQDASGPRQLAELREHARGRGWEVVAEFTDRQSGATDDRPGLQSAVALVESHRAEVLVIHDLDRLGRNVTDLLRNADRISAARGNLAIRNLEVDTTSPEGRLHFTMMAGLAEYHRRSNVGKVLSGLAAARKKGVRLGREPIAPATLERARALRAQRVPTRSGQRRMSWAKISDQLRAEKLGDHARTTIRNALNRAPATKARPLHRETRIAARRPVPSRRVRPG